MKPYVIIAFIALLSICSCKNSQKKAFGNSTASSAQSHKKDTVIKTYKPVMGYRFTITGDFNGDGKKEILTEHYFSSISNSETNKFYEGLNDYDQLVKLAVKKKPCSFITCSDKLIDTLQVSVEPYLFGLAYLKNEGDLDGDGGDEVSYVVNWADWSSLNSWNIMTYKHGKWKNLYSFSIWDWQLPDIPQTYNEVGLMGRENIYVNTTDTPTNKKIAETLHDFKGLVKKVATNKIRIIYMGDDASLDTEMVNLKTKHKSKY